MHIIKILSVNLENLSFELEICSEELNISNRKKAEALEKLALEHETSLKVGNFEFIHFVAVIFNFRMNLENIENPFVNSDPIREMENLSILFKIEEFIFDLELLSRIQDFKWIFKKDYQAAKRAIDTYCKIFFEVETTWDSIDLLKRALTIASKLKDLEKVNEICDKLFTVIEIDKTAEESFKQWNLLSLYCEFQREIPNKFFQLVKEKAFLSAKEKAHDREQRYYELLARGAKKSNLEKLVRTSALLKARSLKRSAVQVIKARKSNLIAAKFIRDAIDSLNQFKVNESIRDSYYNRLMRYQEVGISNEFVTFTHSVDATDSVAAIRQKVGHSDRLIAIQAFTELYDPPSKIIALKEIKRRKDRTVFSNLFGRVSFDGRSKITASGESFYGRRNDTNNEFEADLIEFYSFNQRYYGANVIPLAIFEMNTLNYYDSEFLSSIVEKSPIIFEDQKELAISALYYGMNSELHKFAYIGVPLFENILRNLLRLAGVSVVHQESGTNIQKEYNLDSILNHQKMKNYFFESEILDFKALLVDPNGAQLRHNVAHGLHGDNLRRNPIVYYFYFLFIKVLLRFETKKNEFSEDYVI
ncbi:DUF4209 domain-containing protein [Leptospira barantonii]|uniref:DUF4209 domain-containing protein n=1 Tax=Leptospira barantonii TaxID=2023184 RepID=A0ABX4NNH4_9LEPT|nr:DUF4209 domain-containing protein [Leptospira barantonii]PJZ58283.1 hypothetical protein CH367_07850 [Leptospira barantonii]